MEILFQVRVVFSVCSHSSKMLFMLNVSSIACTVIAFSCLFYSCSSADSCTPLTLWKAGLLSCSSKKASYFCSSNFLLICLSLVFLQDLRSVGAREGRSRICRQRPPSVWQHWLKLFPLQLKECPEQLNCVELFHFLGKQEWAD